MNVEIQDEVMARRQGATRGLGMNVETPDEVMARSHGVARCTSMNVETRDEAMARSHGVAGSMLSAVRSYIPSNANGIVSLSPEFSEPWVGCMRAFVIPGNPNGVASIVGQSLRVVLSLHLMLDLALMDGTPLGFDGMHGGRGLRDPGLGQPWAQ
jgi:hypothetical protein